VNLNSEISDTQDKSSSRQAIANSVRLGKNDVLDVCGIGVRPDIGSNAGELEILTEYYLKAGRLLWTF